MEVLAAHLKKNSELKKRKVEYQQQKTHWHSLLQDQQGTPQVQRLRHDPFECPEAVAQCKQFSFYLSKYLRPDF